MKSSNRLHAPRLHDSADPVTQLIRQARGLFKSGLLRDPAVMIQILLFFTGMLIMFTVWHG